MTEATEAASPQAETLEPASGGLDAIISGAIEKSGYGEEPKAEQVETPEVSTEPKGDDRPRDANGRFIPKDSASAEPSQEPVQTEAAVPAPTDAPAPAPQPMQAPARWSEADKAAFAKLPPDAQNVWLERYNAQEADYTRKTQEVAETRKAIEPLVSEVSKWSPYLQQLGVSPDQAFSQMLNTEFTLRTGTQDQKVQALAYLAQTYGVSIPLPGGQDQQPVDPAFSQLRQEIFGLKSELTRMTEQQQVAERQWAQAEFDAIGQTKDESGSLRYPHFGRVNRTMLQLVAQGQAQDWATAYQKAVRLDDDLFKETVESERKRVVDDLEKQRLAAVEKAKKAAPVATSTGSPKGGAQVKGLDAHLSGALDRAGFGG